MIDFQNIDLTTLEELKNKAKSNEVWVENGLDSLAINWNPTLAQSILGFLLNKLSGSSFVDDDFELPTSQDDLPGELKLGKVIGKQEIEFRTLLDRLNLHAVAAGSSGFGKTEFGLSLAEQAYLNGIPSIWIVDPKAREYLPLARKYRDFIVLTWKELRFSLYKSPHDMQEGDWISVETDHLSQSFNFWEGATGLILEHIAKMNEKGIPATLLNLEQSILHDRRRLGPKHQMSVSTAHARIQMLNYLFGPVINTPSTMLEQLCSKHVIFLTSGLSTAADSWLTEFLLLWRYMYHAHNS